MVAYTLYTVAHSWEAHTAEVGV